jgi:hypothetical protein
MMQLDVNTTGQMEAISNALPGIGVNSILFTPSPFSPSASGFADAFVETTQQRIEEI